MQSIVPISHYLDYTLLNTLKDIIVSTLCIITKASQAPAVAGDGFDNKYIWFDFDLILYIYLFTTINIRITI